MPKAPKKHVQVTIDEDLLTIARAMKLNLSEIAQNSLDAMVNAHLEYLKESARTLEDVIQERKEFSDILHQEAERIRTEQQQIRKDMMLHVRAAKEAGIERGQAETDYGHVFPDAIWNGE